MVRLNLTGLKRPRWMASAKDIKLRILWRMIFHGGVSSFYLSLLAAYSSTGNVTLVERMVTTWYLMLQIGFIFLTLVHDVMCLLVNNSSIFLKWFSVIRNIIFISVVFPFGLFVPMTYWSLFLYNSNLIHPNVLEITVPNWVSTSSHSVIAAVAVLEMTTTKYTYRGYYVLALILMASFAGSYMACLIRTYSQLGFWMYPIFHLFTEEELWMVFSALAAQILALFFLGAGISYLVHGGDDKNRAQTMEPKDSIPKSSEKSEESKESKRLGDGVGEGVVTGAPVSAMPQYQKVITRLFKRVGSLRRKQEQSCPSEEIIPGKQEKSHKNVALDQDRAEVCVDPEMNSGSDAQSINLKKCEKPSLPMVEASGENLQEPRHPIENSTGNVVDTDTESDREANLRNRKKWEQRPASEKAIIEELKKRSDLSNKVQTKYCVVSNAKIKPIHRSQNVNPEGMTVGSADPEESAQMYLPKKASDRNRGLSNQWSDSDDDDPVNDNVVTGVEMGHAGDPATLKRTEDVCLRKRTVNQNEKSKESFGNIVGQYPSKELTSISTNVKSRKDTTIDDLSEQVCLREKVACENNMLKKPSDIFVGKDQVGKRMDSNKEVNPKKDNTTLDPELDNSSEQMCLRKEATLQNNKSKKPSDNFMGKDQTEKFTDADAKINSKKDNTSSRHELDVCLRKTATRQNNKSKKPSDNFVGKAQVEKRKDADAKIYSKQNDTNLSNEFKVPQDSASVENKPRDYIRPNQELPKVSPLPNHEPAKTSELLRDDGVEKRVDNSGQTRYAIDCKLTRCPSKMAEAAFSPISKFCEEITMDSLDSLPVPPSLPPFPSLELELASKAPRQPRNPNEPQRQANSLFNLYADIPPPTCRLTCSLPVELNNRGNGFDAPKSKIPGLAEKETKNERNNKKMKMGADRQSGEVSRWSLFGDACDRRARLMGPAEGGNGQ